MALSFMVCISECIISKSYNSAATFGAMAAMFKGLSDDKLAGFEQKMAPSEWLRQEWGGYSDDLAAARRLADQ